MEVIGLKELLQAGVHFGHQTHRWNPKMRKYIFAERGGIYLIDLKKTLRELNKARELVNSVVRSGNKVLFVCTKRQLAEVVRAEAERSGSFFVTERWLGGMLTNFQTIKKNIRRLKDLERGVEEGAFEFYTKKERLLLERERLKLDRYLAGIKDMTKLPGLVFVVDSRKEEIAVREANRLGIPVVAIADTNADPDMLTIPIAGNDDAIRSVSLITGAIADEIEIAIREIPEAGGAGEEDAYTYSTDAGAAAAPGRKKRARPKRRPKPEMIAKRLHTDTADAAKVPDPSEAESETEASETAESAQELIAEEAGADSPAPEESTPVEEQVAAVTESSAEDGDPEPPSSP